MKKSTQNLLLIEDNPGDARLFEELVRDMGDGRLVTCADRLSAGMQLLEEKPFECVFLDLSLPDGNGLDLIQKIRANFSIPIIVLTGLDDQNMAVNTLRLGAQDYLVKGQFDVSGLKRSLRYAQERKNIEEEKRRVDIMKDSFISTVSHELRTPLAIVKSAISNLKDGILGELNEKQVKVVATTSKNIERLNRLITNLLDLSRLESGRIHVNFSSFDIVPVIYETLLSLKSEAHEKGIEFHFEPQSASIVFEADQDMMIQILMNLSDNAIRFARKNVKVTVGKAKNSDLGELFKRAGANLVGNDFLYLSIEDDGKGMDVGSIPRLFNKFEQVNRPAGGKGYHGTGLGLAICKEIVELHNGLVWAESVAGQFMRFNVILPCSQNTASSD
ncbi:hybrid sensor histidine kinase/response regulator [bacterium]|nr:hybrid sensor histidine kinase/response regulator [bacterium]